MITAIRCNEEDTRVIGQVKKYFKRIPYEHYDNVRESWLRVLVRRLQTVRPKNEKTSRKIVMAICRRLRSWKILVGQIRKITLVLLQIERLHHHFIVNEPMDTKETFKKPAQRPFHLRRN
jgi:hypothetical protein